MEFDANMVTKDGKKMMYLICNTTREEREKIVKDGRALASLGGTSPTEECMALFNKYIDGEMELEEIKETILAQYKKGNN